MLTENDAATGCINASLKENQENGNTPWGMISSGLTGAEHVSVKEGTNIPLYSFFIRFGYFHN